MTNVTHSFWGQDPSGYCGCSGCDAPDPEPTEDDEEAAERQDQDLHPGEVF